MQMLASNRRPCAVRRFPPGCGRPHNAAAAEPPPYHQLPTTAAAAAAAAAETKPTLPNPSTRAATNAAPPPATASFGAQAPGRGVGSGRKAAAPAVVTVPRVYAVRRYPPGCGRDVALAKPKPKPPIDSEGETERDDGAGKPSAVVGNGGGAGNGRNAAAGVPVPRVSAVRRYPPGCGRDVALSKSKSKPPDSESEDGAGKPSAVVGNGDPKARASEDGEVMLRASALGPAEFSSDGGMANGGDGEAGAQEDGGGKPWEVSGLMAVPFLPWAQHERRSQLKA